jgi:hypothetical protein
MQQLKEEEQRNIIAGASISASMINGFIKGATLILELGRSLGTALRRAQLKKLC